MTAMRAVPLVLLLLLAGCVSRALPPPRPTTSTATTTPWTEPTNPVKGVAEIQRDMTTVRTWLTNCAPGMPRTPACDWDTVHATARSVLGLIDVMVGQSARPESEWRLTAATREAASAFNDFGNHCVDWLSSGSSADVVSELNCVNRWEWLPFTWTELEAAVSA